MKRTVPAILLLGALFCPVVVPAVRAAEGGEIPRDATALCVDGTWSSAGQKKGACSSHGGIKTWVGKPPRKATARCKDGTYTKSAGEGACSSHGGVAYWFKERTEKG
jgi:uncharacterized protein DUF3761